MKKSKTIMGALVLMIVATIIIACSKQNATRQETTIIQDEAASGDLTLSEMIEALSWEEGRAFFENQPIKDYTAVCEMVLNDCEFTEKSSSSPTYVFGWHWATPAEDCISQYDGLCFGIKKESSSAQSNARCYFEGGKLIIVPDEADGFTADGYLAIGAPIEIQNDTIIISEGVYAAYFDEVLGRYVATAVDYRTKQ